ncbi:hypothetical protein [Amycolatopsis taiwanensis]|uniref:hypothetical protein n=1 Tax=Amycolatopsis taiwanensis TaxID=342230 RepID=UPI000482FC82|nr:hypothetical protein [Amycolatopsis taiwanensis]
MTDGFTADVQSMRTKAGTDLPDVSAELGQQAALIRSLEMTTSTITGSVDGSSRVFGTEVGNARTLGQNYDQVVHLLAQVGIALSQSISTAAERLGTIADHYEQTDQTIAGE